MRRPSRRLRCSATLAALVAFAGCRLPGSTPRNVLQCRAATERGLRFLEQGRYAQAEKELAQAVGDFEGDVDARRHYAEALWQRGALDEAFQQLEAATKLAPTDPQLWIRAGQIRLAMGQPDQAWPLAETALELDPKSAAPWILRGQVLRRLGRSQDALADFLRALGYDAANREALAEVADVYLALSQPQRALTTLQAWADTYPPGEEPPVVAERTAGVLSALGRHAEASDQWAASVAQQPPSAERYQAWAESLLNSGRPIEAKVAAEQALALSPGHARSAALLQHLARQTTGAAPLR